MKVSATTTVRGNARAAMEAYTRKVALRAEAGLVSASKVLINKSLELVPRDVSALAESAFIRQTGSGFTTCLYVGYGAGLKMPGEVVFGPSGIVLISRMSEKQGRIVYRIPANYAAIVHYDTTMRHDVGQSHYLSTPIQTERPAMRAAIREEMRRGGS